MIIVLVGFRPDPIGGRDLEPNLPYTRQQGLSLVRTWPDITQGEALVENPSLYRQAAAFLRVSKN